MSRTTVVQDIADQVTCGICLEHFKIPKTVMPCLHNFCECCLKDMIESTAHHIINRKSNNPAVFATFSFPCPSCRADVEFPVRFPRPWEMKRIAKEAVQNDFKTNFQIKNQLDIINTKIKQGCQEHQGEIKMWFCKVCKAIICQFCVLQNHNSGDHDITLLNLAQKKQAIRNSKELVKKQMLQLESSCVKMEGQLTDIHHTKGSCEEQKKLIVDEFTAVRVKLDWIESAIYSKQEDFFQQLIASEIKVLTLYQDASEDLEHYKTKIDELDEKLADADLGIGSSLDENTTETSLKPISLPSVEIPKRPEISLDRLQERMQEMKDILASVSDDLGLSDMEADFNCPSVINPPRNVGMLSGQQRPMQPFLPPAPGPGPFPLQGTQLLQGFHNISATVASGPPMFVNQGPQPNVPRGQTYLPKGNMVPRVGVQTGNITQTQQQQRHQQQPRWCQPNPLMMPPSFVPGPPAPLPPPAQYMGSQPLMGVPQSNTYDQRQSLQFQPSGMLQQHNTMPFYQQGPPPPPASVSTSFYSLNQGVATGSVASTQHSQLTRPLAPVTTSHQQNLRSATARLVVGAGLPQPPTNYTPIPSQQDSLSAFQSFYHQQLQPIVSASATTGMIVNSSSKKTSTSTRALPLMTRSHQPISIMSTQEPTRPTRPLEEPNTSDVTSPVSTVSQSRYPWEERSTPPDSGSDSVSAFQFPWEERNANDDINSSPSFDSTDATEEASSHETPTTRSSRSAPSSPLHDETHSAVVSSTTPDSTHSEHSTVDEEIAEESTDIIVVEASPEETSPGDMSSDEEAKADASAQIEDELTNADEVSHPSTHREQRNEKSRTLSSNVPGIQLKYKYKKDQWSPRNPEGKKQYDRDFLMQFKTQCTYRPKDLPRIPGVVVEEVEEDDGLQLRPNGRTGSLGSWVRGAVGNAAHISSKGAMANVTDVSSTDAFSNNTVFGRAEAIKGAMGFATDVSGRQSGELSTMNPTTATGEDDGLQLRPNGRIGSFGSWVRGAVGNAAHISSKGAMANVTDVSSKDAFSNNTVFGRAEAIKGAMGFATDVSGRQSGELYAMNPTTATGGVCRGRQQTIQESNQEPLTAHILAQASKNEQKQMLGERLFPIIYKMHGDLAGKLTGMLLEIDNTELLHFLESRDSLTKKVEEAVEVLKAYQSKKAANPTRPVYTSQAMASPDSKTDDEPDDERLSVILGSFSEFANRKKWRQKKIHGWIEKNVDIKLRNQPKFIRSLVFLVCKSTLSDDSSSVWFDPELLKDRVSCLTRYIDGDANKELQVLFAVQEIDHDFNNPPGFLRMVFEVLYDEDVISEDTFFAWQSSADPIEQTGKDEALKSVERFFAWLNEDINQ